MDFVMLGTWAVSAVVLLGVAGVAWFVGAVSTSVRWQARLDVERRGWVAQWRAEREKHDALVLQRWAGVRAKGAVAGEKAA